MPDRLKIQNKHVAIQSRASVFSDSSASSIPARTTETKNKRAVAAPVSSLKNKEKNEVIFAVSDSSFCSSRPAATQWQMDNGKCVAKTTQPLSDSLVRSPPALADLASKVLRKEALQKASKYKPKLIRFVSPSLTSFHKELVDDPARPWAGGGEKFPSGAEHQKVMEDIEKEQVTHPGKWKSWEYLKKGDMTPFGTYSASDVKLSRRQRKRKNRQALVDIVGGESKEEVVAPTALKVVPPIAQVEPKSVKQLILSHEQMLARNAKILFRGNYFEITTKRMDRPLRTSPKEEPVTAGLATVGGAYAAHMPVASSAPAYRSLCATAMCYLKNPLNQTMVKVRVLLDSGAGCSLIMKHAAKKAGLSGVSRALSMNVAGGHTVSQQQQEVTFQLVSMDKKYCSPHFAGWTSDLVTAPFAPTSFKPKRHLHLKDLVLAEKFPNNEKRTVHMIVGEPYFSLLEENEVRESNDPTVPKAVKTKLGWVLRGATGITKQVPMASAAVYSVLAEQNEIFDLETMNTSMGFDFHKFWTGENVGLSPHESMHSDLTAQEERANEFHEQTARYNPATKRWTVHLPWIEDEVDAHWLSDNLPRAVAFYHNAMRKVTAEQMPYVIAAYEELIEKGYVEEVPQEELRTPHPNYVMTSRPVFRMDKATTKCRIVINASLPDVKNKNNTLNKMLMPGPNKLPQIMELVIKLMFMEHIFLIDVKKMFLSVDLALQSDKDMLRYVWAKPGDPIKVYRHKTLAFGVISSPFQAMSCLHNTAKLLEKEYPEAADAIQSNTYMDDNSGGSNNLTEAKKLLNEILLVMESGGFLGHKIAVSNQDLVEGIAEDRLDKSRVVSVLGLKLDLDTSDFMFNMDEKFAQFDANAEKISRRDIVALASMIFDTQGFVSPYIMQYKKILPMLWRSNIKWDDNLITRRIPGEKTLDPVAQEAVKKFREWIADVDRLKELRFPRYISGELEGIAIFGDASKTGIGCVAYAIKKQSDGTRKSHIIYSKSSLMPKNLRGKAEAEDMLTIARAELIALLCCVHMSEYIRNALKPSVTTDMVHIFTDSLLNLQRVQRGKGKCKPWEERRVLKILERKGNSTISFCPGVLNPADLPSRGCDMDDLTNRFKFWSEGPEFLCAPKEQWPKQPQPAEKVTDENAQAAADEITDKDVKVYFAQLRLLIKEDRTARDDHIAHVMAAQNPSVNPKPFLSGLVERFSSPRKIRNVIAYVLRFIRKARKQGNREDDPQRSKENLPALPNYKTGATISTAECLEADLILARHVQELHLSNELEALEKAQESQGKKPDAWRVKFGNNSPLKDLPCFYDANDRVIRLRTRMHLASTLPFDTVNPIILPKCLWGERLILETHQNHLHCSQKQTFHEIRQKYWVLGGFSYVKQKVRKLCLTPRCRYIKYEIPKMSPLPEIRMDKAVAWRHVGVDYFGPINSKHDCSEKVYGEKPCKSHDNYKIWGAVFTCMTSRSVNVELIRSCSTGDFLNAFRRHVAVNGRPDTFYSDQAKNFTAADKQLQQVVRASQPELVSHTYRGNAPIIWKYSSPTAPWANGCTERLVGIFKKQLQIALQRIPLTYEQLTTISKEICASVNDRPLGVTEQGSDDVQVTPNMLVRGRPNTPLVTAKFSELTKLPHSEIWSQRKETLRLFWDKWQKEYLATLSVDSKWAKGHSSVIKPGDVVIIKPETLGKNQWRIARVTEVHKNLDGLMTTATVRLPSGTVLKRTLRQLALLESSFEALEKTDAVMEERPVISTSQGDNPTPSLGPSGVTSLRDVDDVSVREQKADAKYPEEKGATPSSSAPATLTKSQDPLAQEETGMRKGKRARRDPGYYRTLAKGNYSCQELPMSLEED